MRWVWAGLFGVGVFGARPATAGDVWAEGAFRPSYVMGTYEFADEVNPGYGQTGVLELQAPLDAKAFELAGTLGYADSRYFAIGAGPSLILAGTHAGIGESTIGVGYIAALSLEVGVRPLGDGLLLRPAVGLAQAHFLGSTNDIGSAQNIFEFETLRGPVFSLSAGWAEGLLGVSMKVSYARLEADRSKLHPLVIGIGLLVQHWDLPQGR